MWTYAKTDWHSDDYFEYEQYNRIKGNIEYLIEFAFQLYENWIPITIEELTIKSLYYAKVFNAIEDNIKLISEKTFRSSRFESTKTFVQNENTWLYSDVNRIERTTILFNTILETQYQNKKTLTFTLGGDYYG